MAAPCTLCLIRICCMFSLYAKCHPLRNRRRQLWYSSGTLSYLLMVKSPMVGKYMKMIHCTGFTVTQSPAANIHLNIVMISALSSVTVLYKTCNTLIAFNAIA